MNDEHAWIGRTFTNHIREEQRSLFGGSVGPKRLYDGVVLIVNSFGHANEHDFHTIFVEVVFGKFGRLGVGLNTPGGWWGGRVCGVGLRGRCFAVGRWEGG